MLWRPRNATLPADPLDSDISRQPTILVVDDENSVVQWLNRSLHEHGYDPVAAANVDSAIAVLESLKIDAVVLDLRLGDRSGLDVLRYVRASAQLANLPVLILTGVSVLQVDEEETIRKHKAYVIYKPEGIEVIVETLRRALPPA